MLGNLGVFREFIESSFFVCLLFNSIGVLFSGGAVVKNPNGSAGDSGSISVLGRSPGGGNGNPLQYSCLKNPMDRGAWRGYSPWGLQESDTTE